MRVELKLSEGVIKYGAEIVIPKRDKSIPLEKIEDFGVHADQYYSLNVEVFTSSKDTTLLGALWNKYWVNTLSTSPLISVSPLPFKR